MSLGRRLVALTLGLYVAAPACDSKKQTAAQPDAEQADAEQPDAEQADAEQADAEQADEHLAASAQEHYDPGYAVRDTLIRDDVDAVADAANWLAEEARLAKRPDPWRAHLHDTRNAARLLLDATNLAERTRAAGQMAGACGTCHHAMRQGPEWTGANNEKLKHGRDPHLAGHPEGERMLWEGLAGPSDAAWESGLLALARDPLVPKALADGKRPGKGVAKLAAEARAIANKGSEAKDIEARAELYGDFLATCAACHEALGVKIASPYY